MTGGIHEDANTDMARVSLPSPPWSHLNHTDTSKGGLIGDTHAGQKTTDTAGSAFDSTGGIGSQFTKTGAIGGAAEKVGGPFASTGAVGKQFTDQGSIGGSVQNMLGNQKN